MTTPHPTRPKAALDGMRSSSLGERAGLAGLTLHELEPTAASLAIRAGANANVVQQMLGMPRRR